MTFLLQKSKSLSNFEVISIKNIIRDGHLDLLENLFLQGHFHIDFQDENGSTMLNYAISFDKIQIAKFLIDSGINPNTTNVFHFTPLQEATHLKRVDIITLLRNHGACFKHKQDCDQIFFGERNNFFEKLSLMIDILFSISPFCVHFFHNTYNSNYLFACSTFRTTTPSFSDFLSNFIFLKDNLLFQKNIIHKTEIEEQKELFFFLPFVNMYNIEKIFIIPLRIHQITLGYFFTFSSNKDSNLENLEYKKDFFSKILENDFLNCKEMSPMIYETLVNNPLFQKYLKQTLSSIRAKYSNYDLYLRLLKWIDLSKPFWCILKEKKDASFFQIIENLLYIKEFITPHGKFKNIRHRISELTQQLVATNIIHEDEFIHFQESHIFQMMVEIEYPYQSPITVSNALSHKIAIADLTAPDLTVPDLTVPDLTVPDLMVPLGVRRISDLTVFNSYEYFNITGIDLAKSTIVHLNDIYSNYLQDTQNFLDCLKAIHSCLCNDENIHPKINPGIRDSVVTGVIHEYQDTFYLPPQEIEDGLEFIKSHILKDDNIFHQFYHFYFCVLHFIHPFQDGNGKSCRILMNFFLKSHGISKTVCKQTSQTFLLFSDYCQIILENQQ